MRAVPTAPPQQRIVDAPTASPAVAAIRRRRRDGLWTRLRRTLFGESKPVFED